MLQEELVDPLGLDGAFIGMPHNELYRRAELTQGVTGPARDRSDWQETAFIFAGFLLAAWASHRLARATLSGFAPDWKSWTTGKRFPMGLALGPTLIAYLALCAFA